MTPPAATAATAASTATAATLAELRARAWQAVTTRVAAGKPITATTLADHAHITRGAADAWLREWSSAGRLTAHRTPGRPAPYLTTYLIADPRSETTMPAPATKPARPAADVTRGAAGTVRRDQLIPAALSYAERGWHVFPLRPNDKRPAFPAHSADDCDAAARTRPGRRDQRCARAGRHVTWEERATTDRVRIRRAWSTATPAGAFGIGIACGPSALVVIDLDVPKPGADTPPDQWQRYREPGISDGADVFAVLSADAGQPVPWDTFTVRTASGGVHLYYAAPAGIELRNTTSGLGWLIDTRAAGGYVVAPPSTAAGRPYTYGSDSDARTAPLPDWLTSRLTPAALPPQAPVSVRLRAAATGPGGAGVGSAYLDAAIGRSLTAITDAAPGGRNRALYGAAVSLGQLVAGGALDRDATAALLEAAGRDVGQTPTEAARTVASGLRAGANRPRHLNPTTTTTAATTQGAAA